MYGEAFNALYVEESALTPLNSARRPYLTCPNLAKMDQQPTTEMLRPWDDEEPKTVTGSVVEFAFGNGPQSYFATSYPYRAEYAAESDTRTVAT
jgi:hypothetical protein